MAQFIYCPSGLCDGCSTMMAKGYLHARGEDVQVFVSAHARGGEGICASGQEVYDEPAIAVGDLVEGRQQHSYTGVLTLFL